jgi:hypothetical protein
MGQVVSSVAYALALTLISNVSYGQEQELPCSKESAAIEAAAKKFQPQIDSMKEEGNSIEGDKNKATISGTLDIKMVEQTWVLGVPEFKVTMNKASFDVPTATMKTQRIVYDTIETTMVPTKTGQYPETVVEQCMVDGPFGSKFSSVCTTIRWKDIITSVPQFKKVTTEIKLDIPEFSTTKWSLDIPNIETKVVQQTWKVKIPEITVRNFTVEASKLKERGERLGETAKTVEKQQHGEVTKATAWFYSCQANNLRSQKKTIQAQYSEGIAKIDQAIAQVQGYGIDPTRVKAADGTTTNLVAVKEKLVAEWNVKSLEIDAQADKLETDGHKMVAGITA